MADDIRGWLEAHRVEPSTLATDEIVGIGHALLELGSIAGRLRHPEVVLAAGGALPRGLLLHGSPGTGKTTCARWLARSIGAELPVYELAADELTAPRVRALFGALTGVQSVVIVDEIDAVALRRDWMEPRSGAVLRALLAGLDGLTGASGPLLVVATTRSPYELDPAFVRAGRVGIHIALEVPDEAERAALLRVLAHGRVLGADVDWAPVARATEGHTPADLRALLDDALGLALLEDRRAIGQADLLAAAGRDGEIEPVRPPGRWWDGGRLAGLHEAGHVAVAVALRGAAYVRAVRVRPGSEGATATGVAGRPIELLADDELLDQAAIACGGLVAERLVLGAASLGSRSDVLHVTGLLGLRADAGLDAALPPLAVDALDAGPSEHLRGLRDAALIHAADRALAMAEGIVAANQGAIVRFADALMAAGGELAGDELRTAVEAAGFHTLEAAVAA